MNANELRTKMIMTHIYCKCVGYVVINLFETPVTTSDAPIIDQR